eukprot:scaffold200041_cov43-Prasinocladus_malaysianus.AAC.1
MCDQQFGSRIETIAEVPKQASYNHMIAIKQIPQQPDLLRSVRLEIGPDIATDQNQDVTMASVLSDCACAAMRA